MSPGAGLNPSSHDHAFCTFSSSNSCAPTLGRAVKTKQPAKSKDAGEKKTKKRKKDNAPTVETDGEDDVESVKPKKKKAKKKAKKNA